MNKAIYDSGELAKVGDVVKVISLERERPYFRLGQVVTISEVCKDDGLPRYVCCTNGLYIPSGQLSTDMSHIEAEKMRVVRD